MMILLSVIASCLFQFALVRASDCEYSTPNGTLDLRTLSYTDRPRYSKVPDTSPQALLEYSFNPCFSYSTSDVCKDAAACSTTITSKIDRLLARQVGRTFTYAQGLSTLLYTDGGKIRLSVFLLCAENDTVKATRNDDSSFFFYVENKCACPGRCTYKPDGPSGGLGFGAIFVIILICLVAVYLIFGFAFLRFVKHEQGLNLIPNRLFWVQLGADSIGGVRFILSKVTGRNRDYAKYCHSIFTMFLLSHRPLPALLLLLLLHLLRTTLSQTTCIFDVGNGEKLDIRPLGLPNGKGPKYDNIPMTSPLPYTFSWNACFPYKKSDGGDCTDSAACYTDKRTGKSTRIVPQDVMQFEHHDNLNLLVYQTPNALLTVYLTCLDTDEDKINGRQDDAETYNIYIQSRCCCPGKCQYTEGSTGMGAGAVLVIIFIVLLAVYLIGGMVFLRFRRGASGLDMIPNRSMWLSVTSHAVDGMRYSLAVIRHQSLQVNYDKV